ncbi:MAG TPA: UDP-3-O-(3-hydroxymyristoyl)glucosamine N-acyltransferase [Pirellulales bacterium]|jgi:UDP-3-O-[3-hydroxymyristoyl] glucosamine N-acyltransferase|nr:UDP-3-O-(3-hydroxymyristoyl)glucosamine N-acyltransferase [Pirellulales bacterium]
MATNLAMLAELVGGRLLQPASAETPIAGAATLADAGPNDITLLDNPEKAHRLARSRAGAVVVPEGFSPDHPAAIQVADVHQAFGTIVAHFRPVRIAARLGISPFAHVSPTAQLAGDVDVHPGATVADDARIGPHSTIHAGVYVGAGSKIGSGVTIYPNAVLYENTVVGARSVIHAAAVLGAYGFGYKMTGGQYHLSAQLGNVEIGCDVEIGAGTTIDRGTYSATTIGDGTKIDNQVMIAHNCRIGRHNMICSQVGIAGSTTTGDYVVMAGQVGVRDHVHIGAGAVLGAQSGVVNDVPDGAQMLGAPAVPLRQQKVQFAHLSRLPEMRQQIKELHRQVETLLAAAEPHESEPRGGSQAAA